MDTLSRQAARSTRAAAASAARLAREAAKQAAQHVRRQAREAEARRRAATAGGRWLTGIAPWPGGLRRYRLFLPATVARGQRLPLLVLLHGCHQDAESIAVGSGMNKLAAREGFAVLYPEQDRLANAQGCWNWFDTRHGQAQREMASVLATIAQASLAYPIDPLQVGIAGLSAGASLAALMATTYPARFKAVAMHSGVPPGAADSGLGALRAMRGHRRRVAGDTAPGHADDVPWPPLLVVQGDADLVVSARNALLAATAWAEAAGAKAASVRQVARGQRLPMQISEHRLRGQVIARCCLVSGLGHAWSGGARGQPYCDPLGPDASRLIWAWLKRHLPR